MDYDIRVELKTQHRHARAKEHRAASKLAQVQMELWSQYSDHVKESSEATALMETLNKSYDEFMPKVKSAVDDVASKMNLNRDQAANFAGQILPFVAEMQTDNGKHAK